MKYEKEISVGAVAVLLAILYFKPSFLGFTYNTVLGKLIFVVLVVYLTLTHCMCGLLAVVLVAVIASSTGMNHLYEGVDGTDSTEKDKKKEEEEKKKKAGDATAPAAPLDLLEKPKAAAAAK